MDAQLQTVETAEMDADELTPKDREILEYLADGHGSNRPWGRSTPSKIAEEIGSRKQYVYSRLQVLKAAELVRMHTSGVYEVADAGIEISKHGRTETWGTEE